MTAATAVAGVIVIALLIYTLTGGADYGGGVWDLFALGPRAEAQRARIAKAIGPIWEANHVWLILVIVLLFVGFPKAFAALSITLHLPLTLLLFGIVLRGSAFVFRAYDDQGDVTQRRWSRIFAVSSVFTPILLGVSLGAVAGGAVRADSPHTLIGAWLAPFPLAVGLFTLGLFALLAAVYLCVEVADDPALQDDFRRRGIAAAVFTAAGAYGSLVLARSGAPLVFDALTGQWWSLPFQGACALLGGGLVAALYRRRFVLARALTVTLVVAVELGWTAGQFPFVLPPDLTIQAAAAPPSVLLPVLWALGLGALVLVPAFVYLYTVFKSPGLAK